jgi:Mrp family chromosome partitioning ATPase
MTALLAELQHRFDAIIVDTPPLGAAVDPFVLGSATGNMLLVLRADQTDRNLAGAKLKLVNRLPIRVLGTVLNAMSAGAGSRYYAYYYYNGRDRGLEMPQLEQQVADLARRARAAAAARDES